MINMDDEHKKLLEKFITYVRVVMALEDAVEGNLGDTEEELVIDDIARYTAAARRLATDMVLTKHSNYPAYETAKRMVDVLWIKINKTYSILEKLTKDIPNIDGDYCDALALVLDMVKGAILDLPASSKLPFGLAAVLSDKIHELLDNLARHKRIDLKALRLFFRQWRFIISTLARP